MIISGKLHQETRDSLTYSRLLLAQKLCLIVVTSSPEPEKGQWMRTMAERSPGIESGEVEKLAFKQEEGKRDRERVSKECKGGI